MTLPSAINQRLGLPGRHLLSNLVEGQAALLLPEMAAAAGNHGLVHICRDDAHMALLEEQIEYFAPELFTLRFPAWDCLPYDRISPSADILARRLATLAALHKGIGKQFILLTTVNAVLQRVLPRDVIASSTFIAKAGMVIKGDALQTFMANNGYSRVGTVVESGDFAVRGGLIDLFPPGFDQPVRLDFFGETLESIRSFDPQSQRSTDQLKELRLNLASEVALNAAAIGQFRTAYAQAFGGMDLNDPLYESITNGRRYQGMEHWMPLFAPKLESLFDYVPGAVWFSGAETEASMAARHEQVSEYFDARREALSKQSFGAAPYKPLPPERLYLTTGEWQSFAADNTVFEQSPFASPSSAAISCEGKQGRSFAAERSAGQGLIYDAVRQHTEDLRKNGTRTLIACWTDGSAERLGTILRDHELAPLVTLKSWADAAKLETTIAGIITFPLEQGFEAPGLAIISEQDILGDRLVRRARKAKKAADFLSELSALSPGDLMVHVDHGIGRFDGLRTIEVQGAPHDCLLLFYADNARLFLPVENLELLSRYGAEGDGVQLDRLGGGAWQAKKAKLKQRIREIAGDLIKTAAARELKAGDVFSPAEGVFDEFCARFPYEETEDQLSSIEAVLDDLQSGKPMDRLICGDVGFGKTEVALRAAFFAAYSGKQVAVVVPTTLLSRQHFKTFTDRFKGLPLRIAQASRLVPRKEIEQTKAGLTDGSVDIVIGTHALLVESIKFRDLGLMIIDEEQHFGVKHKERLKQMRANVHVLTLSATPIPRTLQLALSGIREMSLITTPPLDRLAVRTYIAPFDPIVVREHLLREHFRGGQSFYVVPRITDLDEIAEFLREMVPEVKFRAAHGRNP
ncbi:MAG: DEAD/DEAH box helicase [Aestuariivirga sp.]